MRGKTRKYANNCSTSPDKRVKQALSSEELQKRIHEAATETEKMVRQIEEKRRIDPSELKKRLVL